MDGVGTSIIRGPRPTPGYRTPTPSTAKSPECVPELRDTFLLPYALFEWCGGRGERTGGQGVRPRGAYRLLPLLLPGPAGGSVAVGAWVGGAAASTVTVRLTAAVCPCESITE